MISALRVAWVFVATILLTVASTSTFAAVAEKSNLVPLASGLNALSEDLDRLDIGIVVFDPGIPDNTAQHRALGIFPIIRKAESRYLPYLLRQTLVATDQWGVVRVMPKTYQSSELLINGHILKSNGETFTLAIKAVDSAGRVWLNKTYSDTAVEEDYSNHVVDPFQEVFDHIAADLLAIHSTLSHSQRQHIAQLATLRYGAELSLASFAEYLHKDEAGIYQLRRLPAENDPMLERVEKIREYEYLFIDNADEQYLTLFSEMKKTYSLWRQYSRELTLYIKDYEERKVNKGHLYRKGSLASMTETYGNYEWSRMQEQYMDELSSGFNNELSPTVLELDDSVIKLTGDLEMQYTQWRSILLSLFELERGENPLPKILYQK